MGELGVANMILKQKLRAWAPIITHNLVINSVIGICWSSVQTPFAQKPLRLHRAGMTRSKGKLKAIHLSSGATWCVHIMQHEILSNLWHINIWYYGSYPGHKCCCLCVHTLTVTEHWALTSALSSHLCNEIWHGFCGYFAASLGAESKARIS